MATETIQWAALIAVALGVIIRQVFPWLTNAYQALCAGGEIEPFDKKFMLGLVIAIIVVVITIMSALATFAVPEGAFWFVVFTSFMFGYGMQAAIDVPIESWKAKAELKASATCQVEAVKPS